MSIVVSFEATLCDLRFVSEDRKAKGQVSGADDELKAVIVTELGLALKGKQYTMIVKMVEFTRTLAHT